MEPNFFLNGLIIGFSIAVPVGPIGVLCIRRSLADGPRIGLAVGLGAATADAAYGAVAGFGLTAISGFLINQQVWLALIGGLFLCCLGAQTFLAKPPAPAAPTAGPATSTTNGWIEAFLTTFFLTLTNPMTILSFLAIFAGFGVAKSSSYLSATQLVTGVFLGSALWWLILSTGTGYFRERLTTYWMLAVNRLSGAIILTFGLLILARQFTAEWK